MCAYTASPFEFYGSREKDERDQGKEIQEGDKEDQEWGSEAQAACEELVGLGLCERSADGSRLALHPDVGRVARVTWFAFDSTGLSWMAHRLVLIGCSFAARTAGTPLNFSYTSLVQCPAGHVFL